MKFTDFEDAYNIARCNVRETREDLRAIMRNGFKNIDDTFEVWLAAVKEAKDAYDLAQDTYGRLSNFEIGMDIHIEEYDRKHKEETIW